jgi:acyl carrier protein
VPELRRGFGAAFSVTVDNEEKLVVVQEVGRTQRRSMAPADVFRRMVVAVGEDFGLTPHQIVLVEPATIEKTSSGKIARALCRRAYLSNELQSVATWTEGGQAQDVLANAPPSRADEGATLTAALKRDIELQIATIAAEFLKTDVGRVSRTTPWSELGFDSVNALQLALKVEHATGIKLDATMLWECADIQELAARMAGTPGAAALVASRHTPPSAGPQPAAIAAPASRSVDELLALSDAAAEALLMKELER